MARVKKLTEQTPTEQQGQPATSAGQSGFVQASGQPTEQPKEQTASASGSFVNLKSYLDANKKSNLGGKIAQNIQGAADNTRDSIQGAALRFGLASSSQVQPIQNAETVASDVAKDPTKTAPDDVKTVQSALGADYKGPKSLADMSGNDNSGALANKVQNVGDLAGLSTTDTGRFSLLRNMFGRSGYNRGQQRLDNALVQGNKEQLNKLRDTTKTASELNREFGRTLEQTGTQGQEAAATVDRIRKNVLGTLSGRVSELDKKLGDSAIAAQDAAKSQIKKWQDEISSGKISKELADVLGLKDGQYISSNINLANLFNFTNPETINRYNLDAGSSQRADITALSNLLNNYASGDLSKILESYRGSENDEADKLYKLTDDASSIISSDAGTVAKNQQRISQIDARLNEINTLLSDPVVSNNIYNNGPQMYESIFNELNKLQIERMNITKGLKQVKIV